MDKDYLKLLENIVNLVDDEIRPYMNIQQFIDHDPLATKINEELRPLLDYWREIYATRE